MTAPVYLSTSPAASHNVVSAGEITADRWTVVATRTGRFWSYRNGHTGAALVAAADADTIVLMHRRAAEGWELVARLAGPVWRRFQAQGRA
jgi:hypothetical protein